MPVNTINDFFFRSRILYDNRIYVKLMSHSVFVYSYLFLCEGHGQNGIDGNMVF